MRGKITIKSVEALVARVGKEAVLRDAALAGFEARARPGGGRT